MRLSRLALLLIAAPLLLGAEENDAPRPTKVIRQPPPKSAPALKSAAPAPPPRPTDLTAALERSRAVTPLPILLDPLAECRRACSPSYYQCQSGDDASSCSPAWLQCRSDCARPPPAGL